MDDKGSLATYFGRDAVGFQPVEVEPGLFVMAMNTEDSLREYLRLFVRVPVIGSLAPLARIFEFVANAAPAVKEILAIGKICHEVRENTYDLIVVDAEATGHFVAQVSAPDALMRVVQIGVVADQTAWMREILHDAARTTVVAVTTAEELPVSETIELRDRLRAATPTPIGAIVVNRVNPALAMSADDVQAISDESSVDALINEVAAVTGARESVAVVVDALRLAVERSSYQQSNVAALHAAFADDVAIRFVGEAPGESSATATGVSEWIATELGGVDDPAR
jgi:anion-transporting  ArsA/GET3 family ATPase